MISEDKHKTWNVIYLSDKEFVSGKDKEIIEEMGSLNFHTYIIDYDNDGYLDILLPNRLESSVGILNCKFPSQNKSEIKLHVEIEEVPQKPIWQYSPFKGFINHNFGSLEDIVLINIDITNQLVITALYE